jgi:predicted small metal-binding protein
VGAGGAVAGQSLISNKEESMSKHIACDDIVRGCGFTATATSEDELMKQVTRHAECDHGVKEVTPELAAKVKAAIKDR